MMKNFVTQHTLTARRLPLREPLRGVVRVGREVTVPQKEGSGKESVNMDSFLTVTPGFAWR